MHIRVSRRRRGDKTYQYAQLVESYRRPDGIPAHRIIANLGNPAGLHIENMRIALKAARQGKPLVIKSSPEAEPWQARILANLRYLDVAVALETWRRWDLGRLFNRLLPRGLDAVPSSAVRSHTGAAGYSAGTEDEWLD